MTKELRRKCKKCGQKFLLNHEFFRPAKTCKNGLSHICRKCFSNQKREWKIKTGRLVQKPKLDDVLLKKARTLRNGIVNRGHKVGCDLVYFSVRYFYNRLNNKPVCDCCGVELDLFSNTICSKSPSVDRIDSSAGYINGNVAILCWDCNRIKKDGSLDEFYKIVYWMKNDTHMQKM
jgi:hypothetical protein